jgi:hypothetical protein
MSKKVNLYWPVYKNLEKEVLILADQIHFSDDQLGIYSVKIAELLLRCATEIEAISKDLYEHDGGDMTPKNPDGTNRDLYFDTDCLQLLETEWLLSKKQVIVSSSNFFFERDENNILTPLHKSFKRGSSGSDWKKAYMAIKHNRTKDLKQANLKNLIRAMAALYLLNIYYSNKTFDLKKNKDIAEFDSSLGSSIFSIKIVNDFQYINDKENTKHEYAFIRKQTNESKQQEIDEINRMNLQMNQVFMNHPKFVAWLNDGKKTDGFQKNANLFWNILGKDEYIKTIQRNPPNPNFKHVYEAVLNKNQEIY